MSKQSISLLKIDEPKWLRAQCISEHCTEKISKRRYSKTTVNPNKGKISKPLVDEGAIIAGLVETNQLLTNVNKLIEASISTDKVQLIELQKYSLLPTGFTVIDLSILSDAFSLLACPVGLTTNTCKLQASQHWRQKERTCDLCKLNAETVNLNIGMSRLLEKNTCKL